MALIIERPERIPVPGGKIIEEFFGRVRSSDPEVSIARMQAPPGWEEPGQTPEFDEYTVVLSGTLIVETAGETHDVKGGQGILSRKNQWVRYRTGEEGAEYVAVCLPAFSPETVQRDES